MKWGPLFQWNEVVIINGYAIFLGYVSMAIKGLGFLVLTWTTVVLLGGFISTLQRKDFWCLTFITLVQMAGIFDVALNEKLRHIMVSAVGLYFSIIFALMVESRPNPSLAHKILRGLLAFSSVFVQLVVIATVLCPLALIYVFGILMSAVVSLWRLIEHDYTVNSEVEASNFVPALDTLYYLALVQGVLFCYRFILHPIGKKLVKMMPPYVDKELVYNYLRETRQGCEKDPSFAIERNFITHAVDILGSQYGSHSPADFDSGVNLLYTALYLVERPLKKLVELKRESDVNYVRTHQSRLPDSGYPPSRIKHEDYVRLKHFSNEQQKLLRHLVLTTSSSRHIMQKLLETLDSTGTKVRATRNKAAMIVEHVAFHINLAQFPHGIESIASLIGTFQQYNIASCSLAPSLNVHRNLEKAYKELLLRGLHIFEKLAAHGNNCRVISDTQDLVSKIMAPVTADLIHNTTEDHGSWMHIVEGSMKVMVQLTGAPGETGTKLRREISRCEDAINTLRRILSCTTCNGDLKVSAIQILTRLYMDTEGGRCGAEFVVISSCTGEDFVRMLVDIFTDDEESSSVRACAGAAVAMLCCHGGISDAITGIQTAGGNFIDSLTKILVHNTHIPCIKAAAAILEHLCTHVNKQDACCGELKKAMADVMPKVIEEIHSYGDRVYGYGRTVYQDVYAKAKDDMENQGDDLEEEDIIHDLEVICSSSSNSQDDEQDLVFEGTNYVSSLLSLCGTVCDTFITDLGPDLARQFHDTRFIKKLEMVVTRSEYPTDENLLQLKAIGKMVISMMKHDGGELVKQEDLKSLIEALSSSSKNMAVLDNSMVFSFASSCGTLQFTRVTPLKLRSCTLAYILKEAKDLHAMMPSTPASDADDSICLHAGPLVE